MWWSGETRRHRDTRCSRELLTHRTVQPTDPQGSESELESGSGFKCDSEPELEFESVSQLQSESALESNSEPHRVGITEA